MSRHNEKSTSSADPLRRTIDWDRLLEDQAALRHYRTHRTDQLPHTEGATYVRHRGDQEVPPPTTPLSTPTEVLRHYWGYEAFRLKQAEIIDSILAGRDTLGLLPTGGGKSITFQVPTLLHDGLTLVVTPLIALMKDQVDALNHRGLRATTIHSGMEYREVERALDNCLYGGYKFLYISPERISSPAFQECLPAMPIRLIVVDECHCISQWGYDFRPSYLQISEIRRYYPGVPILALTATATPQVAQDVMERLDFAQPNIISSTFARPNLHYVVRTTEDKRKELLHILDSTTGSSIVYCRNRELTKELARELAQFGHSADYYHAGLSHAEREMKQNAWMAGEVRIMVCTNAFGMGIDKPDVRLVVHWSMPSGPEEYFQEAGRAGRDGQSAYAVVLYNRYDRGVLRRRVENEFPPRDYVRDIYDLLCSFLRIGIGEGQEHSYDVDLELFIRTYRLHPIRSLSAIHILELAGAWELHLEENRSRITVEVSREEIYLLRGLSNVCEEVLRAVLRTYGGLFTDYVYIDERSLSIQTGYSGDEVYEALTTLTQRHIVHYVPRKRLPRLFLLHRREEKHHILIPRSVYEDRKAALTRRIDATIAYLDDQTQCRQSMLLAYFGERGATPCGYCDTCVRHRREARHAARHDLSTLTHLLDRHDWAASPSLSVEEIARSLQMPRERVAALIARLISSSGRYQCDGETLRRI